MSHYAIYDLIGTKIEFQVKGEAVSGICTDVKREVLENQIVFTINEKEHRFLEPHRIENDEDLVFVYGSEQTEDLMEFCGENYSIKWGEDLRKSIGREKAFLRTVIKKGQP
jgi:hypothetical protein